MMLALRRNSSRILEYLVQLMSSLSLSPSPPEAFRGSDCFKYCLQNTNLTME